MSTSMTTSIKNLAYEDLNSEIKRTMRRSAKDAVQLGFMLRRMLDEKLWKSTYDCFDEYLDSELHMDYSMANRFININKKYSLWGSSMEISEKYESYSQGLLMEMLSMPPELKEKVTPDMTVKQVREIKKQAKKEKEPESVKDDVVIDGEYREVIEPENIATSQPESEVKKCITGWSRYGICSCCGHNGVKCCNQCQDPCNSRCRWIDEPYENEAVLDPTDDELKRVRNLLEEKKHDLEEWMNVAKVEDIPEPVIFEKKTIVGALASMVYELENVKEEPDPVPQPELPALKNNDQRKEWLGNYKSWGLWYRDENIDVNYYKFDFEDGSRLIVSEYPDRHCYWNDELKDETYYHLLEKNKKSYKKKYDEVFRHSADSETYLVDFLKNLQKKGK